MKTDYEQISKNLIANRYPLFVGDVRCPTQDLYIDENRKQSIDLGFNKNLIDEMAIICGRRKQGNHGTPLADFLSARFNEVLINCKKMMPPVVSIVDFDTSDTTNPLIFGYQLIVDLHRDFCGYIFVTIDIENFKNYFRKNPTKMMFNEGITFPEICYFFGKIEHRKVGVSSFPDWMKNHIDGNNYGKNKKEFNRIVEDIKEKDKNDFSLKAPQKKALENKDKIDRLLNPILSK